MFEVGQILHFSASAKKRKQMFDTTYKEAYEYILPQMETFNARTEGEKRNGFGRVFDSTAVDAYQKFVSNIQSSIFPPMKDWIDLQPGPLVPDAVKSNAARQLKQISEIMFAGIRNSNFDTSIAEVLGSVFFGTGVLHVGKGTKQKPFRFTPVPLSKVWYEEGADGNLDSFFFEREVPFRNLKKMWSDFQMPERMAQDYASKPSESVTFIEGVVPTDVEIVKLDRKTKQPATRKMRGFQYFVICEKYKEEFCVSRQMEMSPFIGARWSKVTGEVSGRGPALYALADVKSLNAVKELVLKNASLSVAGAYTAVDDGVVNIANLRIAPGAIIPVSSNGSQLTGPSIAALPRAGDFNVAQFIFADVQNAIRQMTFSDPLGPIDLPVKSATEIAYRQQELSKRIGSAFGRLQYELVVPLVNLLLYYLDELDLIDLGEFRVDGQIINIAHISPIAMAQDQEELNAMRTLMEIIVATFGPQVAMMLVKSDVFVREAAKRLKLPPNLVRTEAEYEEIRQRAESALGQVDAGQA